jgi:hypothetical protein
MATQISDADLSLLLQQVHRDITKKGGLLDVIDEIEGDNKATTTLKIAKLGKFSAPIWKTCVTKKGHQKYKHIITGEVLNFTGHATEVKRSSLTPIAATLERIVRDFHQHVFQVGWDQQPNFAASANRARQYFPQYAQG